MNLGYIPEQLSPIHWLLGANSPIKSEEINSYGDWRAFTPVDERQDTNGFDEMNCAPRAENKCIAILYKYKTGKDFNPNDRYLSTVSKTSINGNSAWNVYLAMLECGLIDENDYTNFAKTFAEYVEMPPQNLIDHGKEFLKDWTIQGEFIGHTEDKDLIFNSLKKSPLAVSVKYADGQGILFPQHPAQKTFPDYSYNHFVCCDYAEYGKYWEIIDNYTATRKKYHWNYEFGTIMKFNLENNNLKNMFKPQDNILYNLVENLGGFALGLDGRLIVDDTAKILSTYIVRNQGIIGNKTKTIVQKDYDCVDKINLKGELIEKAKLS